MLTVEKRVTTEYIFNDYGKGTKVTDVLDCVNLLKEAGVDIENAELDVITTDNNGYKSSVVRVVRTAYYDESTKDKMNSW